MSFKHKARKGMYLKWRSPQKSARNSSRLTSSLEQHNGVKEIRTQDLLVTSPAYALTILTSKRNAKNIFHLSSHFFVCIKKSCGFFCTHVLYCTNNWTLLMKFEFFNDFWLTCVNKVSLCNDPPASVVCLSVCLSVTLLLFVWENLTSVSERYILTNIF